MGSLESLSTERITTREETPRVEILFMNLVTFPSPPERYAAGWGLLL